jgi:hypothetical protein
MQQERLESKNWEAYKNRYSVECFESVNAERVVVSNSRSGLPTLRVTAESGRSVFLHSSIDPVREAEKVAAGLKAEAGMVVVVYGFGLGYLAEALLAELDERIPLFVIEPDRDVFCAAMRTRDLGQLIQSDRVYVQVGDSAEVVKVRFFTLFSGPRFREIAFCGLPGHQTLYGEFHLEAMKVLRDVVNIKLLNLVTLIQMGPDFMSNGIRNLPDYYTHPGVKELFNRFRDVPAIIVSAGPSLNKNIHLLHEAKGKAVVIAVGTAVKALQKHGIYPDFIVSVDPHPLNYEHFKGLNTEHSALLIELQSHYQIFETYRGPIFVSGKMSVLQWFEDLIENKGVIESGGSVANNAMNIAYKMGADPIIFVGQDLAYAPDGHSHAAGTNYENKICDQSEGLNHFYVKANAGGKILTDRPFFQFLRYFEHWIHETSGQRRYINATEGGAYIEGTEVMTLREALDTCCQEPVEVKSVIRSVQEAFVAPDLQPLQERFKELKRETKAAITDAGKALERLTELEKACDAGDGKRMRRHLNAVAKINKKFDQGRHVREMAEWFNHSGVYTAFYSTYTAEFAEQDDYHAAIADNRIYYQNILTGAKCVQALVDDCIKKIGGRQRDGR